MNVETEEIEIAGDGKTIPALVAWPAGEKPHPGLLLFSDIFELTPSMRRAVARFAGYGFVVVAPKIYHRFDGRGRHDFDDNEGARRLSENVKVEHVDSDVDALIAFAATYDRINGRALHATGFCIGGHIAFRAGFRKEIKSTVSFYPTGLHSGVLGGDRNVDTLARCGEFKGELLVIFGASDNNVPLAGRRAIEDRLREDRVRYLITEYDGPHAFMRDEGPRYNPPEADRAVLQATHFFHSHS